MVSLVLERMNNMTMLEQLDSLQLNKIIEQYRLFLQIKGGPWEWESADESECSLHQVGAPYEDCILACTKCSSCSKQNDGPLCRLPDQNHARFIANSWSMFNLFVKLLGNSLQQHLVLSNEYYKIVRPSSLSSIQLHSLIEIPFVDIINCEKNYSHKWKRIDNFRDDCFYSKDTYTINLMIDIFRLNWIPSQGAIHYKFNKNTMELSGPFSKLSFDMNDYFFFPSPEIAKLAFKFHGEQMKNCF